MFLVIFSKVAMATSKPKTQPTGPIISGQVLVQSAQEKDLMKQVQYNYLWFVYK